MLPIALAFAVLACGAEPVPRSEAAQPETPRAPRPAPFEAPGWEVVDESLEALEPPKTVGELIARKKCSTGKTAPLNAQIAAEVECTAPGSFSPIDDLPNVKLGAGANPFLQRASDEALARVAALEPTLTMVVNSTWRSPVQQAILKAWQGSCGVSLAAPPGRSKHESGQAIDVPLWTIYEFYEALKAEGWVWFCETTNRGFIHGCRDVPHYVQAQGRDLRAVGVKAFQKLWNRAHPSDRLPETGQYDRRTASRMLEAPLRGFETGASCGTPLQQDPCPAHFRDVTRQHRYFRAIEAGQDAGLWGPCDPASPAWFCPSEGVSRAELVEVIAKALELPLEPFEGRFEDLGADHPAAQPIEAAARHGITGGCDREGARFCPSGPATWDQAAALIARGRNLSLAAPRGRFEDVPQDHWAAPHIEAVAAAGFMAGCQPGAFCPEWRLSRARMAQFVTRAFSIPDAPPCLGYSGPDGPEQLR